MTKEDIKYIKDYLEWVSQNMNPAEVDFEHFANGMMNCNNILMQALSLHNVSQQRELLVALIKWFRTDGLYYSKTEEEVVDEFLATNCG
tara:strand:+ start:682 stop:948 length:267 start_codon:yes stop_codon:yes gene_type:complete